MKNLLLIILMLLSGSCFAQNKYEQEFKSADSMFTKLTDSLKSNRTIFVTKVKKDTVAIKQKTKVKPITKTK